MTRDSVTLTTADGVFTYHRLPDGEWFYGDVNMWEVAPFLNRIAELESALTPPPAPRVVFLDRWYVVDGRDRNMGPTFLSEAEAREWASADHRVVRVALVEEAALADADAGEVCAQAFHISEYIEEEMAARGWDRDELALRMGGDFGVTRLALDLLMELRTPDVIIGEQAEQLGRAFGTSAALWRNLHETWRNHPSTPCTPVADAGGDDA